MVSHDWSFLHWLNLFVVLIIIFYSIIERKFVYSFSLGLSFVFELLFFRNFGFGSCFFNFCLSKILFCFLFFDFYFSKVLFCFLFFKNFVLFFVCEFLFQKFWFCYFFNFCFSKILFCFLFLNFCFSKFCFSCCVLISVLKKMCSFFVCEFLFFKNFFFKTLLRFFFVLSFRKLYFAFILLFFGPCGFPSKLAINYFRRKAPS